jgi:hypothetical protein
MHAADCPLRNTLRGSLRGHQSARARASSSARSLLIKLGIQPLPVGERQTHV